MTGPLAPELAGARRASWRSASSSTSLSRESRDAVVRPRLPAAARGVLPAAAARAGTPGPERPTVAELEQATPTREALDRAMGERRDERTLSLSHLVASRAGARPRLGQPARAFAGLPQRQRLRPAWCPPRAARRSTACARTAPCPAALLETDPGRLELLGVRWVQVPTDALVVPADADGLGERARRRARAAAAAPLRAARSRAPPRCALRELPLRSGRGRAGPRSWPSAWRGSPPGARSGSRSARGSRPPSGPGTGPTCARARPPREAAGARELPRARGLHGPPVPRRAAAAGPLRGHARCASGPGPAPRRCWLLRAGLRDAETGRGVGLSAASAYVSDEVRLAEAAGTPLVSLFEVRRGIGPAWVVESLRRLPDDERVLDVLRAPDPPRRRHAARGARDRGRRARRRAARRAAAPQPADVARAAGGRIVVRAGGPGAARDRRGLRPRLDGARRRRDGRASLRVNGDRMGVVLAGGHPPRRAHAPRARARSRASRSPRSRRSASPPRRCAGAGARFDPPRSARASFAPFRRASDAMSADKPGLSIFFPAYNDAGTIASLALVAHMTARDAHRRLRGDRGRRRQPRPHGRAPRRDGEALPLAEGRAPREEPRLRRGAADRASRPPRRSSSSTPTATRSTTRARW